MCSNAGGGGKFTKQPTLNISMQYFGNQRRGIRVPKKHYGKLIHEINTAYENKYKDAEIIKHTTLHDNVYYEYSIRNYGYDNYVILARRKLK